MMRSLRARLMFGTGVTTAVLIGAASVVLYFLVRSTLYAEFDQLLAAKARALAVLVEQDRDEIEIEFAEHPLHEFEREDRPEYFQVWLADGRVLARSSHLSDYDLPRVGGEKGKPGFRFVRLPDGRSGRVVGISFRPTASRKVRPEQRRRVTLVLARETTAIEATLVQLAWLLATVASALVLMILAALAWVIHRGLGPARQLANDIDRIDEDQLDAHFDLDDVPAELLPVAGQLNRLLIRLRAAFEREKSFTADAAHELRTPLAGLRSILEVSLSRRRASDSYRASMQKCLAICRRTQSLVETLLSLARLEGSAAEKADGPRADLAPAAVSRSVHVAGVLYDCWETWAQPADARGLRVRWHLDDSLKLETDAQRLAILIDNLLANAVAHADDAGTVRIESSLSGGLMSIRISNSASHFDADQISHVFDPFWRGEKARSAVGTHAGLGLSLCRKLADSLGCRIAASSAKGGEFSVCLQFGGQFVSRESSDSRASRSVPAGTARRVVADHSASGALRDTERVVAGGQ